MIDLAMDRGGLKDSENAPNTFFPKINQTMFWQLGTDMYMVDLKAKKALMKCTLEPKFRGNMIQRIDI